MDLRNKMVFACRLDMAGVSGHLSTEGGERTAAPLMERRSSAVFFARKKRRFAPRAH